MMTYRKTATALTVHAYALSAYELLCQSGHAEFGEETQMAIVDTAADMLVGDGYEFDRDDLVAEAGRLA